MDVHGYSFTYILFIGLAEVVGAWLLLACNAKQVAQAIRVFVLEPKPGHLPGRKGGRARVVAAALVAMGLLFAVDQVLVNYFGHGRG